MATQWIDFNAAIQGSIRQFTIDTARKALADAQQNDPGWAGHRSIVDGKFDAPIESVKEYGRIQLVKRVDFGEIVEFIWKQIVAKSPVLTGKYQDSHIVMINGTEVPDITGVQSGDKVQFVNSQPYARKIENGLSDRAPSGVYRAVYAAARRRYGKLVFIDFKWVRLNLGVKVMAKQGGSKYSKKRVLRDMVYPCISIRQVK